MNEVNKSHSNKYMNVSAYLYTYIYFQIVLIILNAIYEILIFRKLKYKHGDKIKNILLILRILLVIWFHFIFGTN